MAVELEIDVQVLKSEIKKTHASVSQEPEKDFIFPTGRPWAEDLGYPAELANVPETAVGSFAGVASPWQLGRIAPGERVLDLGSGAGTDSLNAAQMVGEHSQVTGIDMTPEMLAKVRTAAAEMGAATVEFVEGEAEQLPRPARRHLRPLQVRRHASQGTEVRRPRHHRQGLRTGSLANPAARRRGGRGGGDRRARSARRETRARGRLRP
jgi:SAM-dependent methyltransferase